RVIQVDRLHGQRQVRMRDEASWLTGVQADESAELLAELSIPQVKLLLLVLHFQLLAAEGGTAGSYFQPLFLHLPQVVLHLAELGETAVRRGSVAADFGEFVESLEGLRRRLVPLVNGPQTQELLLARREPGRFLVFARGLRH